MSDQFYEDGSRDQLMRMKSHVFARIGAVTLCFFVAVVVVEHFLTPGLSPATHQISEYANAARFGWLMTAAFFSWATSLLATAMLLLATRECQAGDQIYSEGANRPQLSLSASIALAVLLLIAGLGIAVTACFHTETIAGALPVGTRLTASGRLHDIGSGTATLAIALAALASCFVIHQRTWFFTLSASALAIAVLSDVALLEVGASVGGIRERALVFAACSWQAGLLAFCSS